MVNSRGISFGNDYGVNDIGEDRSSINQSQQTKDDTLKLLKLKIDSLENFTIEEELRMQEELASKNDDLVLYGSAGVALLIGLSMGLIIRRKRKS